MNLNERSQSHRSGERLLQGSGSPREGGSREESKPPRSCLGTRGPIPSAGGRQPPRPPRGSRIGPGDGTKRVAGGCFDSN